VQNSRQEATIHPGATARAQEFDQVFRRHRRIVA
jgi:hypothetical protein